MYHLVLVFFTFCNREIIKRIQLIHFAKNKSSLQNKHFMPQKSRILWLQISQFLIFTASFCRFHWIFPLSHICTNFGIVNQILWYSSFNLRNEIRQKRFYIMWWLPVSYQPERIFRLFLFTYMTVYKTDAVGILVLLSHKATII